MNNGILIMIKVIKNYLRLALQMCARSNKTTTNGVLMLYKKIQLYISVFRTLPIQSDNNSAVEVASLVSHDDLPLYLAAIKTLHYFIHQPLLISVYDDGSFTKTDYEIVKSFISHVHIVSKKQCDRIVKNTIQNKNVLTYRDNIVHLRRIIDIPLLSTNKKLILFDSDILFFSKPKEILQWMHADDNKCFFIQDYQKSYIMSDIEIQDLFHSSIVSNINVGLVGCYKNIFNFNFYSDYFHKTKQLSPARHAPWHEQTLFSLLLNSRGPTNLIQLPRTYNISLDKITNNQSVCRHYVYHVRHLFYEDAKKVLAKISCLENPK